MNIFPKARRKSLDPFSGASTRTVLLLTETVIYYSRIMWAQFPRFGNTHVETGFYFILPVRRINQDSILGSISKVTSVPWLHFHKTLYLSRTPGLDNKWYAIHRLVFS